MKAALVSAIAVLAVIASQWMAGWLTREGPVRASSPVPPARFAVSPLVLEPAVTACLEDVTFPAQSEVAVIAARRSDGGPAGPRLALIATGGSWSWRATVPAGWAPGRIDTPIAAPPRDLRGSFCVRNEGRAAVVLFGNMESGAAGHTRTTLDGAPQPVSLSLELASAHAASRMSRVGTMLRRASNLGAGFAGTWLLWPLLVLATLAIPVVPLLALWRAWRSDS